jgi:hypothetical protein
VDKVRKTAVALRPKRGTDHRHVTNSNNNNNTNIGSIDQMSLSAHSLGARLILISYANSIRQSAVSSAQGSRAGRSASSSTYSKSTRHSTSSSNLVPKALSKTLKSTGIQKKIYSR